MTGSRFALGIASALAAAHLALGAPAAHPSTAKRAVPPPSALWEQPRDVPTRDLYYGPWGSANAPTPDAVYTFVGLKKEGANPGVVVTDPSGREWSVKQPAERWAEGPVEVTLSRVLSAVGYHQPPVYFVPSFTMVDASGVQRTEPGGRFRLEHGSLEERGAWSWRTNPFVGTRAYQGLLVLLLTFGSVDFKMSNNMIYDVSRDGGTEQWYVVRDLGAALGERGLLRPRRNDPDLFEQQRFITGTRGGFVTFQYGMKERMLFDGRITPEDAAWAGYLLGTLSDRQWQDAFRAGGYDPETAARFIRALKANIAEARRLASR